MELQNELGEYRQARLADREALTQAHGNINITKQHSQALDEQHAKLRRTVDWAKANFERSEPLLTCKLRVRYNHREKKNHTKFFAKLFSHWLKNLFSGFTTTFKKKEANHHFYYVFLWQQRKEKDNL